MPIISEMLLPEFDEEMKKTRTTLERVPVDKPDFVSHPKSMPLGKLAPHVAQLAGFGMIILTAPGLDFATGSYRPPQPQCGGSGLIACQAKVLVVSKEVARARLVERCAR